MLDYIVCFIRLILRIIVYIYCEQKSKNAMCGTGSLLLKEREDWCRKMAVRNGVMCVSFENSHTTVIRCEMSNIGCGKILPYRPQF
jgi:hypothetical protein